MNIDLMENTIKKREKIEDKYTWDLSTIFTSLEDWEKEFNELEESVSTFEKFRGTVGSSAGDLLETLKFHDTVGIKFGKLYLYAMLNRDIDLTDTYYQGLYQKVILLSSKIEAAASFIRPEIVKISRENITKFIKEEKELEVYLHYLSDIVRTKDHTLSDEKEELLAHAEPALRVSYETFSLLNNADIEFPSFEYPGRGTVEISHSGYYAAMYSVDREYRQKYYKNFYIPYIAHRNTLSSLFNGNLRGAIFNARARNYGSTLEASLDANNIPVKVYDNLVNSLSENMNPLHRWCSMRKKILKVEELHSYDTYVNMFPAVKKNFSYEQAMEIVVDALGVLGDEYISNLKMTLEQRYIDVFESKGKRSGAYSSGTTFGVHPYVLLNWGSQLSDVFTLAHELGHNMHSHFTGNSQPYPYANYSIFVAEVASTLNEALILNYLIEKADSKLEKLSLIEEGITRIVSTVYRQTIFATFEKEVHARAENNEALTPDTLSKIYGDLYHRYWGPDLVEDDEEKYTWARVPHFYYNFYVYQYATSFAASEILAERILTNSDDIVNKYITMLKAGSSDYPINLLKGAGVDMTSKMPILLVASKMNYLLDEMESLI
jgi:oligoendopeptidase F